MAIQFKGTCEWSDIAYLPEPGKNEFGVDTLMRTFQGRADQYEQFLKTLAQGQTYSFAGGVYYLQTWKPEEHRSFPKCYLYYKGLISGRLPNARETTGTSQKSCSKTVVAEGSLPERTYEITYVSPATTLRYVTNQKGFGAAPIVAVQAPTILSSFYIDSTTGRKRSGRPNGLAFASTVDSRSQEPIDGTPWFETEIVASGIIIP